MTLIEVEPQPRVDPLVWLPGGGEARRTDHTGTAWLDGTPQVSGLTLRRAPCPRRARKRGADHVGGASRRAAVTPPDAVR